MVHGEGEIPKDITKNKLLLVEGNDDIKFFKYFLIDEKIDINNIHIIKIV